MSYKLYVAGIGPGDKNFLTPAALRIIEDSDILIGGKRNLEAFEGVCKEKKVIGSNLDEISSFIMNNIDSKKIVVLATGDPGLYSIMEFLKRNLTGVEMEVIPGISSLQYLCSKLKTSWNDVYITSVHGRQQEDLIQTIKNNKKTAIFTGGDQTPQNVCLKLIEAGITDIRVSVGEYLSYESERVITSSPEEISRMSFDSLSIMFIEHIKDKNVYSLEWEYKTQGIPDHMFIRGDVPMTKEEVRAVSLSKLRLTKEFIVYDIGAGTGSVSIECGLVCESGRVYAIEKNPEAIELIKKNKDKFLLKNIDIIEGNAPDALKGLPEPDRVFLGGSGKKLKDILEFINRFEKDIRVVINSITIETAYEALQYLETKGYRNIDIVNISVTKSRKAGDKHLMQAINPVYIISAEKVRG